jgi:hypothetical protein
MPSGVLDEPALERDREGEEEGVELWAVEAFAEVLAGCDDDEFACGGAVLDLLDDRGAGAFRQAPFQNEWWDDPSLGKLVGEPVAVLRSAAENEAPPAFVEGCDHVVANECGAALVFDKGTEYPLDRRFAGPGDLEVGFVNQEVEREVTGRAFTVRDSVADRPALHGDDLLQAVSSVRGGGQAEEVTDGCPPDACLEGDGGEVVAFVDHDLAVDAEERLEVVDRLEALNHREVDRPFPLPSAATELAYLLRGETEQ